MRDRGRVVYKTFNRSTDSVHVLQQVNSFLASNQSLNFRASWVLVARWENTCPFDRKDCPGIKVFPSSELLIEQLNLLICGNCPPQPNTFQVTVATDGSHSYAILTYKCGDLNWIALKASIGFSAEGSPHANHDLSRTDGVNNISCLNLPHSNWSNVVYTLSLGKLIK